LHNRTRAHIRRQVQGIRAETYLQFHCVKWTTMAGKRGKYVTPANFTRGWRNFFHIQLNWYLFIPHILWKNSINGADSNEQGCTNAWRPVNIVRWLLILSAQLLQFSPLPDHNVHHCIRIKQNAPDRVVFTW